LRITTSAPSSWIHHCCWTKGKRCRRSKRKPRPKRCLPRRSATKTVRPTPRLPAMFFKNSTSTIDLYRIPCTYGFSKLLGNQPTWPHPGNVNGEPWILKSRHHSPPWLSELKPRNGRVVLLSLAAFIHVLASPWPSRPQWPWNKAASRGRAPLPPTHTT
jgi:hypothetical protein